MTLLILCRELRQRIESHENLRNAHGQADAFRNRAEEIRVAREALAAEVARATVLQHKNVLFDKRPNPSTALTAFAAYVQKLKTPAVDAGKEYGLLKRALGKVHKDMTAAVDKALQGLLRDIPAMDEVFLKQVERIPGYQSEVERIRQALKGLQSGVSLSGMSANQLNAFLEQRDMLRQLADNLKPEQFPSEVLEFFRAMRQGGAPLGKFSDSVRRWLESRDMLKDVRIILSPR
jgi:hypothetical protein